MHEPGGSGAEKTSGATSDSSAGHAASSAAGTSAPSAGVVVESVVDSLATAATPPTRLHSATATLTAADTDRPSTDTLWDGARHIVHAMQTPALVRNLYGEIVVANEMARALYSPMFYDPIPSVASPTPNLARFVFLDPRSREFYPNWQQQTEDIVAMLGLARVSGNNRQHAAELVQELSEASPEFARMWSRYDMRYVSRRASIIEHPVVGTLELEFAPTMLVSAPDLALLLYGTTPGSQTEARLEELRSWAASQA